MSRTFTTSAALVAALLAAPAASAQEAITLESIGAVRMATPAEVRGRDADGAAAGRDRQRDGGLAARAVVR